MDQGVLINEEEEEQEKCCSRGGTAYRYLALLHMCIIGFGSSFCFDNPGSLQDVISNQLSLTTTHFSYLYSIYNWPNVILCFVGGFLIDRVFGIKLGTVLYAAIVVIGQLIFALGGMLQSFRIMMLGRFIFGVGGESLGVAQNYYAVMWFKGKELNMVFGLQLSLSKIGSAVNFLIMGHLYTFVQQFVPQYEALGVVLLLAAITCVASLISSLCLACMSQRSSSVGPPIEENTARLLDVIEFPPPFWLICFICISYYIAIFPFIALGKIFFVKKYDFTADQANSVNSFIYIVSGITSPLLGLLIDKLGRNLFFVTFSIALTIAAHIAFAYTFWNPFLIAMFLGLSYSLLASALWPMIALVIPEYQLGSAYGVAQALQNTGLAGATLIAGLIVDKGGYFMLELFFIVSLIFALAAALIIWLHDSYTNGLLNMTVPQKDLHEQFKQRKLVEEGAGQSGSVGDISGQQVTQPQSVFSIRNRYLAKLGATSVPDHMHDTSKSLMYRNLR